jgi:hypothetical protein
MKKLRERLVGFFFRVPDALRQMLIRPARHNSPQSPHTKSKHEV